MKLALCALSAFALTTLAACGSGVNAANPTVTNSLPLSSSTATSSSAETVDANDVAAAAYCTRKGGLVEVRRPVYGSNGPTLLFLSGRQGFCQFTRKKDGSRIHILLSTLYTTKPTLAALAYYAQPEPSGSCAGNPASCYCTQLGGSDLFGGPKDLNGGGWYKKKSIDQTLEACIFPDMSSIDSWGLAYHSQDIIRGINLAKVMRYKGPGTR
jgi:putative hemolysin